MNLSLKNPIFLISTLIILLFTLNSCSVDGTNWDIDATAPVVETRLDLNNLIGEDFLTVNTDSSLYLTIDETLYSFNLDTLSSLPPVGNRYSLEWPYPPLTLTGGTVIPGLVNEYELDYDQIKLSKFSIKTGQFLIRFKSTLPERLIVRFYIPKVTQSGIMFEFTDTLPGLVTPGDTVTLERYFDIGNYDIDLSGLEYVDFNQLSGYYDLATITGDPSVTVNTNQTIFVCETELFELTPSYAKGYLGQFDLGQTSSITSLNELQIIQSGMLDLENVSMNLHVHNTIGADLRFTPVDIQGTNSRTNQTVILNHPIIGNNIGLNRAYETGNPSNPLIETIYTIAVNGGNSNIEQLIELLPDQLSFTRSLEMNPFGNTGAYSDFFYYDYPPKIQLELNMPFKFGLNNLLLVDTIDNPFKNLEILDPISDGEFITRVENKFPLESYLQLYTFDQNYTITDSLFSNTHVLAAPVDGNNRVTSPLTTDLIIQATAGQLQSLKSADRLQLKARFNTIPSTAGVMQMYSDYYMLIKIIAKVKFNIAL